MIIEADEYGLGSSFKWFEIRFLDLDLSKIIEVIYILDAEADDSEDSSRIARNAVALCPAEHCRTRKHVFQ